jgi:uncharacterized membrane protein YccC
MRTATREEGSMSNRRLVRRLGSLVVAAALLAPGARAELTAWDPGKVTAITKDLVQATKDLDETFRKQPQLSVGSSNSQAYYRLKQLVRMIHSESNELDRSVQKGEGREETLTVYENLMQLTRNAREDAAKIFVAQDVAQRAAAVRAALNRLGPYYDPDFQTIVPSPNLESNPKR